MGTVRNRCKQYNALWELIIIHAFKKWNGMAAITVDIGFNVWEIVMSIQSY